VEVAVATVVACALAVVMTWPALREPARTIPVGGVDPLIEAWAIAWSGHGLVADPARVFDGNAFFPAPLSLAFTDTMLGYAPLWWLSDGSTLLAYNLAYVSVPALAALGAYALARQLGANRAGALVAALAFAYAPWRMGQAAHLHVISAGPFVLALAMLARGHGLSFRRAARRRASRPVWAALGWLAACWQLTVCFMVGLPFAYLLGACCAVAAIASLGRVQRHREAVCWPLVAVNVVGATLFVAVGLWLAMPFAQVAGTEAAGLEEVRGLSDVAKYSPDLRGLLAPPATTEGALTWWARHGPFAGYPISSELRLLPGYTLIVLALAGLFLSAWRTRWRVVMGVTAVLVAALAVGTNLPGGLGGYWFVLWWKYVPGWAAIRTPGRLVTFTTLALALLAAGLVTRLTTRAGSRSVWRARVISLVVPALVLVEGYAQVAYEWPPDPPAAFRIAPEPTLVLPSAWFHESTVMYWSTLRGFPRVGNGTSGVTPRSLKELRRAVVDFPSAGSVSYLREHGFRSVVVLRPGSLPTEQWAGADRQPPGGLGVRRFVYGDASLFVLE
jgi:hypothetical protein